MAANLITGLVSGLIVTLLVVVFRALWRDVLVPWFEERVYKDIRIEGVWYTLYPTVVGYRQEIVTLTRHGHSVSGSIVCTDGPDKGEQYTIHGSFRNLILTLTYESGSRSRVDRGTITLRCVQNGCRFIGKIANYFDRTDSIESTSVLWFHTKEEQQKVLANARAREHNVHEIREQELEARRRQRRLAKEVMNPENQDPARLSGSQQSSGVNVESENEQGEDAAA